MVKNCWDLDQLAEKYDQFLQLFRPLLKAVENAESLLPEDAFQIRTLLIHEYRRVLLKDTDLPHRVLPKNWIGHTASSMTADLYKLTQYDATVFLRNNMQTADGLLPPASPSYYRRFGGL